MSKTNKRKRGPTAHKPIAGRCPVCKKQQDHILKHVMNEHNYEEMTALQKRNIRRLVKLAAPKLSPKHVNYKKQNIAAGPKRVTGIISGGGGPGTGKKS